MVAWSNLGISKCLGKGTMVIALSNGYGQALSNLNVLGSFPSLIVLSAFFISSHSEFRGVLVVPPDLVLQMVGRHHMGQQNRDCFDGLVDMDYKWRESMLRWG